MKRKLVKQGAATMMISLPSKWIKENKLEKGDEIDLDQKANDIIIQTESAKKKKKQITLTLNEETRKNLKNSLTHIYRKGFDKITIKGIDNNSVKTIRKTTDDLLLGFELTERDQNKCIIENISEPSEGKYNVILKKTFLIIKELQELITKDFEQNKFDNFSEIQDIRNQHDKFILFCRRLLIKNNPHHKLLFEWEMLTFLYHIQHVYFYLYRYASENKLEKDKDIINLLKLLQDNFNLFTKAYEEQNVDYVHMLHNKRDEHQFDKCFTALRKSKAHNIVIVSYIKELFRLIQIGASPILATLFEDEI